MKKSVESPVFSELRKQIELIGIEVKGLDEKAEIGQCGEVNKVKIAPANKVVVAPLEDIPPVDERYLADALESVPIIRDNIVVPYFGGRLVFQVVGVTVPAQSTDTALVTRNCV